MAGIEKLLLAILENPKATVKLLLENLSSAQGVQILNHKTLEEFFTEKIDFRLNLIEASVQKLLANLKISGVSSVDSSPSSPQIEGFQSYRRFEWGESVHDFPEDFKIPSLTSCQMWHLWLFGDSNNVNIPYRMLKGEHMKDTERSQLSKARIVMETIREKIGMSYSEIAALGHVEAEKLFNAAYLQTLGAIRFHGTMKCSNAYKHIGKMKKNLKEQAKHL